MIIYAAVDLARVVELPETRSRLFGHVTAPAVRVTFNDGRAVVDDSTGSRLIAAGVASRSPRHWASALIKAGARQARHH